MLGSQQCEDKLLRRDLFEECSAEGGEDTDGNDGIVADRSWLTSSTVERRLHVAACRVGGAAFKVLRRFIRAMPSTKATD
jgi:hypothetical protein